MYFNLYMYICFSPEPLVTNKLIHLLCKWHALLAAMSGNPLASFHLSTETSVQNMYRYVLYQVQWQGYINLVCIEKGVFWDFLESAFPNKSKLRLVVYIYIF